MLGHTLVAGSEPSVHEEVIGYIDLNNSGLQLVGGDTFYLQTEALREHILMSEQGKEVQPIIVVVEEGSENVVVQAFSRDSEAVGDEAAFTVNQLDSAISATLPEQLTGVETITTSEGQQLLILSENANGKLVGMEGTPVEQSAAAPDTEPLFHEGSRGGVPGQCVASLEDSQTELQQGCKELSEENGSSEADAIPDNVHAPEESAESKYENEGRSHTLAPVDVHEPNKASSSDVSLVFSRRDTSEYREKQTSAVMEPEQDTEEQKNEAVDMNADLLNENLSSDMTVASAQSLESGAVLNLDTSEMPLAPSAGENLDTADLLDVDKHAMSAVRDFKGTEAAGTTLEISEPPCQGTQAQTLDVVGAPKTSNKHFMTDLGTNSLLESQEDKSVPVEAQHTEIPSKESLKEGQSTVVSSKRASQSANFEQPKTLQ
ncbi:hypothetical protein HPB50_024502 [Hyalomma asiaticum]|uniref:Uncharacterized protein n=1 Tax=Hyalomma asiaticum TaxID=266040 RepID=A0ACB7TNQ6_HYAAI|nr:hypothetical protein HPB50_024502 [Hyalomma asiaticum]